jgi:hypothetical protein
MFFNKRKKIVVDAFTYKAAVHDFFPIERATKFFPKWWTDLPKDYESIQYNIPVRYSTMKHCTGFIDLYKNSFILPMWSDLSIKTYEDGTYNYVYSEGDPRPVVSHPKVEYGNAFDSYIHLKIESPWAIREKTGIQFYYGSPSWNQLDLLSKVHIVPGLLDFKYQDSTHVNMLVNRENSIIEFKHGQPMAQIVPLSEHDFEIKTHLLSKQEYFSMVEKNSYKMSFLNRFKRTKSLVKQTEKKCPFGFGG